MREVTSDWISKAEGDYRSAKILLYQIDDPIGNGARGI